MLEENKIIENEKAELEKCFNNLNLDMTTR